MAIPLDMSALVARTSSAPRLDAGAMTSQIAYLASRASRRRKIKKILARHMEGLRLVRPLPHLECFHRSGKAWRIIDGSNRSSKTMSACIELCRAILSADPYKKYIPYQGNVIVVGMKLDHVEMIWRKCAMPGAFKIIRDEINGLYRAVRPDPNDPLHLDPYDEAYREKWRDGPPLIPARMIRGNIAWEDRARAIPSFAKFATGWQIHFHSSKSVPPQGDHYHFALLDEELLNPMFLTEIRRGLVALDEPVDQRPRGIWSATAQTTNPELLRMREQADAGSARVDAFQALIKDNPYVPDEEKQAFHDSLSPEDRRVRYYGEYTLAGMRCYPNFDAQTIHGYEPMEIPDTWCRYLILDPGTRHCGTLFAAVDPQEAHVWVYDGFDLQNGDPATWAQRIAARHEQFQAGIIDTKAGKQRSMGMSSQTVNVATAYFSALKDEGVRFIQEGPLYGFFAGSEDQPGRQTALQTWLTIREHGPFSGTCKLQVARGAIPELEDQVRFAHMDLQNPDRRAKPKWNRFQEDLLVCLEYLAAFEPRYFAPKIVEDPRGAEVYWQYKNSRRVHARRRAATSSQASSMIEMG